MSNEPGWNAPQQKPPQSQSPQSQPPQYPQQNWDAPPPDRGAPLSPQPSPQHSDAPHPGSYPPYDSQEGAPQYQGPPGGPAQSGGLSPNIAAMLSYLLFGWIGGLIMYLTQKDREVRFHAAQSILTFGGLAIISLVITIVNAAAGSLLLLALSWLISLLSFALWIFLSIQGYQLRHTKLPIVGDIAEQWAVK